MDLGTSFDALSEIVEQFQTNGRPLRSVEASASGERDGVLAVTMEIPVSLCSAAGGSAGDLRPAAAAVTDGGGLSVEFATELLDELTESTDAAVAAEIRGVSLGDDGDLVLTVELDIDPCGAAPTADGRDGTRESEPSSTGASPTAVSPAGGTNADACDRADATGTAASTPASVTAASASVSAPADADADADGNADGNAGADAGADELGAVRDESVPPYEDAPYLRRLYEACDTFDEMSRRIEMDVAAETVRRYMIEAGVHDPASYDTAASTDPDSADATEQLVADGLGLPDGLDVEDVVDAVVDATTLFEVQRRLDLDRRPTQELLDRLGLLDLVVHRVSEGPKRRVSHEEVTARIRQCALGA